MKTQLVAVWHVEYSDLDHPGVMACISFSDAEECAQLIARERRDLTCITVTGPHQHRVPA